MDKLDELDALERSYLAAYRKVLSASPESRRSVRDRLTQAVRRQQRQRVAWGVAAAATVCLGVAWGQSQGFLLHDFTAERALSQSPYDARGDSPEGTAHVHPRGRAATSPSPAAFPSPSASPLPPATAGESTPEVQPLAAASHDVPEPSQGLSPRASLVRPATARKRTGAGERNTPAPEHANPNAPADGSLAEELRLITTARQALSAGDMTRALFLLDRHQDRFPHGVASEERAAWRAVALCQLQRTDKGRAAAKAFTADYAQSPHLARVHQACATERTK